MSIRIALEIQSNHRVILLDNVFTGFSLQDYSVVRVSAFDEYQLMEYLQEMSRTGILFLVYSAIPTSFLCMFSNSILVLSDEGESLFYGMPSRFPSLRGKVDDAKQALYDPYFKAQQEFNTIDCIYHSVCSCS